MYLRKIRLLVVSVAVVTALASCASWTRSGNKIENEPVEGLISPENIRVELVPITPQLIMQEEKDRPVPGIPTELLTKEPHLYRIGPGDVLFITVWDHPELTIPSGVQQESISNGRVVHPNGELFYPHVGTVMAMGMSLQELSAKLTIDLSKYIENPQVDVSLLSPESQKVLASGALRDTAPIKISITPLSLMAALGVWGVIPAEADLSKVILTRGGKQYVLDVYQLSRQSADLNELYLQDGDRVHVSYNDTNKVFVMGEVKAPMSIAYRTHMLNLSDALSTAGGLDQLTSNGNAVYVIRGMNDLEKQPAKIFQLKAESAVGFVLASRFQLQPQDVVYVGANKITYWNRVIYGLLPTAGALALGESILYGGKSVQNVY